uniref:(northern house mosquito) hypothetical protein n=1 Tax=Culex pipiens TaxID=7175 RepID=A0A8D8H0T9_CULPI
MSSGLMLRRLPMLNRGKCSNAVTMSILSSIGFPLLVIISDRCSWLDPRFLCSSSSSKDMFRCESTFARRAPMRRSSISSRMSRRSSDSPIGVRSLNSDGLLSVTSRMYSSKLSVNERCVFWLMRSMRSSSSSLTAGSCTSYCGSPLLTSANEVNFSMMFSSGSVSSSLVTFSSWNSASAVVVVVADGGEGGGGGVCLCFGLIAILTRGVGTRIRERSDEAWIGGSVSDRARLSVFSSALVPSVDAVVEGRPRILLWFSFCRNCSRFSLSPGEGVHFSRVEVVVVGVAGVDECHCSAVAYAREGSSGRRLIVSSVRMLELLRSGRIREATPFIGRSRSSLTVGRTGFSASCLISTVGKMATLSLRLPRFSRVMISSTELVSSWAEGGNSVVDVVVVEAVVGYSVPIIGAAEGENTGIRLMFLTSWKSGRFVESS